MQGMSRFLPSNFLSTSSAATSSVPSSKIPSGGPITSKFPVIYIMFFTIILLAHSTQAFDPNRRYLYDSLAADSGEHGLLLAGSGAKRNWNNAAVGLWGKRSSLPALYDIADDTRGALVKRPQDSWTKLNSLWGKRSSWQTATGLWGKRSVPSLHRQQKKRFDTSMEGLTFDGAM